MGVVKRRGLEQKDKANWKNVLPRVVDQDQVLWFMFRGEEVKLVGSELRGRDWWYCLRVGVEYEFVRAVDFNFEASPVIK